MNRKFEEYKEEIIREENLAEGKLNQLIREKLSLPGISGRKMALLVVLQNLGIENKKVTEGIREELLLSNTLRKIEELDSGMRCVSLVAKISRILPKREGKEQEYQTFILLDDSGKIPLTFFGEEVSQGKAKELKLGDPVLLKCANVKKLGESLSLVAGGETKIRKMEEKNELGEDLPELDPTFSIKEILNKFESLKENETVKVNCRGILAWRGELNQFERDDGSTGKVMNLKIAGEESDASIKGVAWGKGTELINNLDLGDIIQIRGGKVKINSYRLNRGSKRREALEIHIGNLTSVKRKRKDSLKTTRITNFIPGD